MRLLCAFVVLSGMAMGQRFPGCLSFIPSDWHVDNVTVDCEKKTISGLPPVIALNRKVEPENVPAIRVKDYCYIEGGLTPEDWKKSPHPSFASTLKIKCRAEK
jgi:hypothetical protein